MTSPKKSPARARAPHDAHEARSRLTLKDVAQALGVSRTTVSNAYNRPGQLSDALRRRILEASRDLGYGGPDPTARALRRRDLRVVGVVFHHDLGCALSDPTSIEFLHGVATELDRRQLALQLIPKMGRLLMMPAALHTTADALIVHAEIGPDSMHDVIASPKPLVLVDTRVPDCRSICTDDRRGAQLAMQHVLAARPDRVLVLSFPVALGERERVMGLRNPPRSGYVGSERVAGYARAARDAGYPAEQLLWQDIDDQYPESAAQAVASLRAQVPAGASVAVVGMSDRIALAALRTVRRWRDVRVVAAVGFDDIPAAAAAGLSTIRQGTRLKGELAVKTLLEGGPASTVLPVELVRRQT